jgi:RNA polymerase sigma-70 factor, ECF subfamily
MTGHDPSMIGASVTSARPAPGITPDFEATLAARIQDLQAAGDHAAARETFGEVVSRQQRRASRIAWHYLRDAAEADEAVQDAFVKAFTHISSFQRELPFEVWFTRILVNNCLDRRKSQARRTRWLVSTSDVGWGDTSGLDRTARDPERSPEQLVLAREWREHLAAAVKTLPDRQRMVFLLCHLEDHTTRDVADMTGLSESTVRVHLFRALRKLRVAMEDHRHAH